MTPRLAAFFLIVLHCDTPILEAIDRTIRKSCGIVTRESSIYIGSVPMVNNTKDIRLSLWSNGAKIRIEYNGFWFWVLDK